MVCFISNFSRVLCSSRTELFPDKLVRCKCFLHQAGNVAIWSIASLMTRAATANNYSNIRMLKIKTNALRVTRMLCRPSYIRPKRIRWPYRRCPLASQFKYTQDGTDGRTDTGRRHCFPLKAAKVISYIKQTRYVSPGETIVCQWYFKGGMSLVQPPGECF